MVRGFVGGEVEVVARDGGEGGGGQGCEEERGDEGVVLHVEWRWWNARGERNEMSGKMD